MRTQPGTPSFLDRLRHWWLPETTPPRFLLYFVASGVFVLAGALWALFAGIPATRNAGLAIGIVALSAAALGITFAVALPDTDRRLRHLRGLRSAARAMAAFLVVCSLILSAVTIPLIYAEGSLTLLGRIEIQPFTSDAQAMTHQANEMVLDGENPYGRTNVITAMENFARVSPTLLRQGAFSDAYPGPTQEQIDEALAAAQANPDVPAPEFESTLSYPAGAFLLRLPTDALGLPPQWFYLLCLFLIWVVIAWRAPPHLRPAAVIGGAATLLAWNSHVGGSTDALYLLFILPGWTLRRRPWLAASLMGIACACKQTAWFFIPFYLVLLLREAGWRRAAQSLAVIGVVFFLVNSPFIAADPQAWISGILAPMTHPLFPYGIGPVSFAMLSHTPVPSAIFTALEAATLVAALAWYYRHCLRAPNTGLLLAMGPLFFAWRSLIAYFATIPLVVFGAALIDEAGRQQMSAQPDTAAAQPDTAAAPAGT